MPERNRLRVAAAQMHSTLNDLAANLERHLEFIAQAHEAGAELLLFPELSMTGHSAGQRTLEIAMARDHPYIRQIAATSKGMRTIFGLIEEGPAAQFHNSLFVVADGQVEFVHRKINLATYGKLEDGKHFAAGRYVETFPVRDRWRGSALICADLWNPILVHLVAVHGCTVLFAPISSAVEAVGVGFDNPNGWATNLRFYAMTYGMPVVMANRVGREEELTFWGGSRVLDPFGTVVAQAGDGEELVVGDLDYDQVRQARYLLPTVRDSNITLVARELERLVQVVGVPEQFRRG